MSKIEVFDKDYFENGVKTGKSNYQDYSWERLGSYFKDTAQHIKNKFQPKTVLDVGCAKGFLVKALNDIGIEAQGVDVSEYALEKSIVPDKTKFGKAQELPFEDDSFDVVVAFDILEHIPTKDVQKVCKELLRVAKKWVIVRVVTEKLKDDLDASHETIKPREYWESKFNSIDITSYLNEKVWWFNVSEFLIISKKK